MALTDLMMEYVSLTNKLRKEDRELQKKQLLYQLETVEGQIHKTIKARSDAK